MAEIRPFRGMIYNRNRVKNVNRVFSPPYDIILPDMQNRLYRAHPDNVVRLILGKQFASDNEKNNRYTRAAKDLEKWLEKGILKQEAKPAIYAYLREYRFDRVKKTVKGFIALVRLEEKKKRKVLPHEKTHAKPKEDRFALMKATGMNFGLIYTLFQGRVGIIGRVFAGLKCGGKKTGKAPVFRVIDHEGTIHTLWRVDNPAVFRKTREAMSRAKIMIADGHHRYETALNYRDWLRSRRAAFSSQHPANFRMIYFADFNDPGLTILPTHRIVNGIGVRSIGRHLPCLQRLFDIEVVSGKAELFAGLKGGEKSSHCFGMYAGGKYYLFRLKSEKPLFRKGDSRGKRIARRLDVSILHNLIIEPLLGTKKTEGKITYAREADKAIAAAKKEKNTAAFFLNATRIEEVRGMAFAGEKMPPKSTYFYPKLITGLVMNSIRG